MVIPNSLQWISVPYWVVSGLFFITGVFFSAFFSYLPRGSIGRKGYLWFGLTCLVLAAYAFSSGVANSFNPSTDSPTAFFFWAELQFILAIPLIVLFIQFSIFHLGVQNFYFRWIFPIVSFSFWICFLFPSVMLRPELLRVPVSFGSLHILEPLAPLGTGGLIFILWATLNSLLAAFYWIRHFLRHPGDWGLMMAFFLFIGAGLFDTAVSLGYFRGPFIFVFGFAGLLIAVAVRLLRAVFQVNQELQTKTRELEEANEELRFLVGTLSHDIMGPLVSINGFTDLLQGGKPFDEQQKNRFLDRIRANAEHMKNLLEDLADYVRIGRVEEEVFSLPLKNIIHQALAMLDLPSKYPQGAVEIMPDWPNFVGSPKRIKQIIINLVQNSFKYSEREDVRVRVWGKRSNHGLEIYVEDNGRGIPDELKEKVFEAFFRGHTEAHGTGMGLAIVRKIAEKYGGKVWFDPEYREGTRVGVYLPVSPISRPGQGTD